MKGIENWCVAVSAVSVVTGIITTLLPKSAIKNTYIILSCVVLLYACIQPVTDWRELKIDFAKIISDSSDSDVYDEDYNSSILYIAEQTYKKHIDSQITDISENAECSCECEYSNGQLFIRKIIITGSTQVGQQEKILSKIKDIIQDTTIVEFRGDNYEGG